MSYLKPILALIALAASTLCAAAPVLIPTGYAAPGSTENMATFDVTTGIYSFSGPFGTLVNRPVPVYTGDAHGNTIVVPDFLGTFTVFAQITNGAFDHGSFLWMGTSASLGITTLSPILAGDITVLREGIQGQEANTVIVGKVLVENPAFQGAVGVVPTLTIWQFSGLRGGPYFSGDPLWSKSNSVFAGTESPDLYFTGYKLPAPSTITLMLLGGGLLAVGTRRRVR